MFRKVLRDVADARMVDLMCEIVVGVSIQYVVLDEKSNNTPPKNHAVHETQTCEGASKRIPSENDQNTCPTCNV